VECKALGKDLTTCRRRVLAQAGLRVLTMLLRLRYWLLLLLMMMTIRASLLTSRRWQRPWRALTRLSGMLPCEMS
jgi:hypothetical protein